MSTTGLIDCFFV